MLTDRRYCYPLTITDFASRYLITCDALETTKETYAFAVFERAFKDFGLPRAIRTDNGIPFSCPNALYGLSRLSVWWLRLGIDIERIKPGHPEQNGRHERMHLTLKTEATKPASPNFLHQQARFDAFIECYNHERPHQALGMKVPGEFYTPSPRPYQGLSDLDYPCHDWTATVTRCGRICYDRKKINLSTVFAPQRAGHAHGPKAHDGTITTETPDVMWGTDMTATVTVAEGAAVVFVAVDHCATACIGLHAAKRGNRFEALEPIRQGIRERFGGIGAGVAHGRRLRHDHGSNYLADDFQQEVAFFGIESSPSFVREPEGNGVAERFIRTLKENVLWVRSFETIEELRLALLEFKRTYNAHWMLEKYDYRSPAQVRRDLLGLDAAA